MKIRTGCHHSDFMQGQKAAVKLSVDSMLPPPDALLMPSLQFADMNSVKSIMIGGLAYCRQADHCTVHYGGMAAEIAAGY